FVAAYDEKHEIKTEGDKATMIVGKDDFPFPIPLLHKGDAWRFDTAAGRLEILYRRIGRNELDAIQASLAYVDASSNTLTRIGAQGSASMPSASSVRRARRMDSTGRRRPARSRARSASWSPMPPPKATGSAAGARRSTATTSRS